MQVNASITNNNINVATVISTITFTTSYDVRYYALAVTAATDFKEFQQFHKQ